MQLLHKSQYAVIAYTTIEGVVMRMYERIRNLREDRNYTQKTLAEILHVNQATYSRYESGVLDIPSQALIRLAKFYHVSVDYLLGLTEEPRWKDKK